MTVAELRAALAALPAGADAWTVVLSRDAAGNAFSPLDEVGRGFYESESGAAGDFTDEGDLFDPPGGDGWADGLDAPNAVCLWPVR